MMKSRLTVFALLFLGTLFAISCSKKDSPKPDSSTAKTFKAVITRDDAFAGSDPTLSLTITGRDDDDHFVKYAADYSSPDDDNVLLTEEEVIAYEKITIRSVKPVVSTNIMFAYWADNLTSPTHLNVVFYYDDKIIDKKQITITSDKSATAVKYWNYNAE